MHRVVITALLHYNATDNPIYHQNISTDMKLQGQCSCVRTVQQETLVHGLKQVSSQNVAASGHRNAEAKVAGSKMQTRLTLHNILQTHEVPKQFC